MENLKKKCTYKEHKEIEAIVYCRECKIYMCNKCEQFHSNLFQNHKSFNLDKDKDISNLFTGFCMEEKHYNELEYFCKNHNQLCCAACIAKVKLNEYGKHKDCDIYLLEDIKNEKNEKLNENIKYLEDLSKTLQESINKIKEIFEKINIDKEELKIKIQKIFTNIRNELNKREDKLLLEVDNQFEDLFLKEEIIKECEKLPSKVNLSLEKSKNIDKNSNINELNLFINDCLEIEKNIKNINFINENIKKSDEIKKTKIIFYPDDEEINKFIEKIKLFGKIEKFNSFKLSSIINNSINYQKSIINWIKEKTNKNISKTELIFKMSENGFKSDDFHKACDNKGPTLILIKTTKNRIFGGFTPLNLSKDKGDQNDETNQTFIFSLNLMKKYDLIKKKEEAIRASSGLNFGNSDIFLGINLKEGQTYANKNCNFLSNNNLELTGGKGESEHFETEEFEVYKIILD